MMTESEMYKAALSILVKAAGRVDDEINEFGKPVSSELYGEFQDAIIGADKLLKGTLYVVNGEMAVEIPGLHVESTEEEHADDRRD